MTDLIFRKGGVGIKIRDYSEAVESNIQTLKRMAEPTFDINTETKEQLEEIALKVFNTNASKIVVLQKQKIDEQAEEIERLKTLLFHFTGEME